MPLLQLSLRMVSRSLSAPALLLGLAVTAAAQVPDRTPLRHLPAPEGMHSIATLTFRLADTVPFARGARAPRAVVAQVWYPAVSDPTSPRGRYLSSPMMLEAMVREKYEGLAEADLAPWRDLTVSAQAGGRPSRTPRSGWSVIVISPGLDVSRVSYTAIAEALASEGYVVIVPDHPYGGFVVTPEGKVLRPGGDSLQLRLGSAGAPATPDSVLKWEVRQWATEASSAVRHIANGTTGNPDLAGLVIDTQSVGVLGHALGGAAALEGCRLDAIFRACADLDGAPIGEVARAGVTKPILVLLSEGGNTNAARDSTWRAILARHPEAPAHVQILLGTVPYSFTDAPFLTPSLVSDAGNLLAPEKAQDRIVGALITFFDHYLRAEPLRGLRPGFTIVR